MTRTQLFTPMREGGGLPEEAGVFVNHELHCAHLRGEQAYNTAGYFDLSTPQGRFAFGCYVAEICKLLRAPFNEQRMIDRHYELAKAHWDFWTGLVRRWEDYARGEMSE